MHREPGRLKTGPRSSARVPWLGALILGERRAFGNLHGGQCDNYGALEVNIFL